MGAKEGKDMDMETILEETVATEDLKKFEQKYHVELNNGKVSSESQFEYAWCLVRSRYPADIRKGIILLEDLFQNRDNTNKRDYLYYLAIGNTKLKEYATALKYVRALLQEAGEGWHGGHGSGWRSCSCSWRFSWARASLCWEASHEKVRRKGGKICKSSRCQLGNESSQKNLQGHEMIAAWHGYDYWLIP